MKPLRDTLSTPEINRKMKALIFMSPPFAHSRKHVIFVTACVIRSSVTGSPWAFKITVLANGSYKNGISLCRSLSIFARALKQRICNWRPNEDVNIAKDKHPPSRRRDAKSKKSRAGKPKTCKFCSKVHPFEKGKCPAWEAKCTKCGGRKRRLAEHRRDVINGRNDLPVPAHFNKANHTLEDLKVTVLKAGPANQEYRKKQEMQLIFKYGTVSPSGLNQAPVVQRQDNHIKLCV